jgi:hypothetical protein
MALTNSGSVEVVNAPATNPQGSPNKNIVGQPGAGPNTARFSGVDDSNASGNVPDASTSAEDAAAQAHTGNPPAAPRVNEVARQAAAATTGDGSGASVSEAFIDGSGHSWSDV